MPYRVPPPGYTDVGRSTPWGNPFHIGRTYSGKYLASAGDTIPFFENYLRNRLASDPSFRQSFFSSLKNKKLWCPGCGCNSPTCHARVIERFLNPSPPGVPS